MAKPLCSHGEFCIIGYDATVYVAGGPRQEPIAVKGCTLRWCKGCGATRANDGDWVAPGTPSAIETVDRPVSERNHARESGIDAVDTFLRVADFDEHGVPDRKIPDCPQCEEDELWPWAHGRARGVMCYRCRFKRELTLQEIAHA